MNERSKIIEIKTESVSREEEAVNEDASGEEATGIQALEDQAADYKLSEIGAEAAPSDEETAGEHDPDRVVEAPAAEEPAQDEESLREQLLRAVADLDNLRKRKAKEIRTARKHERERILRELIAVVDNLERAFDAGAGDEEPNPWIEGVQAIGLQLLETLKKFGAEPFESLGEPFDPKRHDAICRVPDSDKPEGTVIEVVEQGYRMEDDSILRPAKVVVSHQDA